jgi:hypothetical protein
VRLARRRQRGSHLVDDLGLVGCPRRGTDVSVTACLRCRALRRTVTDEAGRVREIRCLDGVDERAPYGPWLSGWRTSRLG